MNLETIETLPDWGQHARCQVQIVKARDMADGQALIAPPSRRPADSKR